MTVKITLDKTVHSESGECSQITGTIDEKSRFDQIVFLCESMKKRRRRIGAAPTEKLDIE